MFTYLICIIWVFCKIWGKNLDFLRVECKGSAVFLHGEKKKSLLSTLFSSAPTGYNEKLPFVKPAPIDEQEAKKQKKGKKAEKPPAEPVEQ